MPETKNFTIDSSVSELLEFDLIPDQDDLMFILYGPEKEILLVRRTNTNNEDSAFVIDSTIQLTLRDFEIAALKNGTLSYVLFYYDSADTEQFIAAYSGSVTVNVTGAPEEDLAFAAGQFFRVDSDAIEDVPEELSADLILLNDGKLYVKVAGEWAEWNPAFGTDVVDALVGTDGTPSTSNKFVTNSDARMTNERVPTALSVTAAKLAADAVETAKIKDANVTAGKLATDAVETAKIKDGNVTYLKLKSQLQEYLKAQGFTAEDNQIIPHNWMPNNYAVIDKNGKAHMMVEIPRKNWDAANQFAGAAIHPAFTINGAQKRIFIGKYQASMDGAYYVTCANATVKHSLTFEQELAAAAALNGGSISGFHLMTNAEWALVALMSKANATLPYGNNAYGRDNDNKLITGIMEEPANFAGASGNGKWLTGTGGILTSHNWQESGIFDLNGNVWERVSGMRVNEGEIQILENNNAADSSKDQGAASAEWKAILTDGTLVAPGTANTLKYNGGSPISVVEAITTQLVDPNSASNTYETVATALSGNGIGLLKSLCLFPHTTGLGGDYIYLRNYGERVPVRGGNWYYASDAGVFSLYLYNARSDAFYYFGFRFAFYL